LDKACPELIEGIPAFTGMTKVKTFWDGIVIDRSAVVDTIVRNYNIEEFLPAGRQEFLNP